MQKHMRWLEEKISRAKRKQSFLKYYDQLSYCNTLWSFLKSLIFWLPFCGFAPWLYRWSLSQQCNGLLHSCWLHLPFQRSVAQGGKALYISQPLLHLQQRNVFCREVGEINCDLTDQNSAKVQHGRDYLISLTITLLLHFFIEVVVAF